ncbi:MAG TPA: S8 family serine peptidase [Steroidobacteraceae bacterium]
MKIHQALGLFCVCAGLAMSASAADKGKLDSTLRVLGNRSQSVSAQAGISHQIPGFRAANGYVSINVVAGSDTATLQRELESLGMQDAVAMGGMVSGRVAVASLNSIAALSDVQSVRPVFSRTRAGLVTTQGDQAMHADFARQRYEVDGSGVRIGVLSDSYGCLRGAIFPGQMFTTAQEDMVNGDLPRDVKILNDKSCAQSNDEGRAIMQILHDVAPGSSLAFHTADNSEPDFAKGIVDLMNAGATVIVDDVIYYDEPMFQDGIVAQAVDSVKRHGVAYFSSAGNEARQSYEAPFRHSHTDGSSGERHNFATSGKADGLQTITVTDQGLELLVLNWDQPFRSAGGAGSISDVDLIFYDMKGELIPDCDDNLQPAVCQFPGISNNIGGDALEEAVISNTSGASIDVQVSIELFKGPAPGLLKYVYFDLGPGAMTIDEYDTKSPTAYGHSNAAGAESVGAASWYNTGAWGTPFHPECETACEAVYSSAGGVPILFDTNGRRLEQPQVRLKPGLTGPDGGNTTFFFSLLTAYVPGSTEPDAFPNFFGTSAAAPHVAAVAALMIDERRRMHSPPMLPDTIYQILRQSTLDIRFRAGRTVGPFRIPHGKGFDFDSGFGLLNAPAALDEVADEEED